MNIRARLFSSSSAHLLVASLLFAMGSALIVGVEQALREAEAAIRPALAVTVFLTPIITETAAAKLSTDIKASDNDIQDVAYQSKEDAYDQALKDPLLSKSMMILKENPLPASFTIRYNDQVWMDRPAPADALRRFTEIQNIRFSAPSRTVFRSLEEWRRWVVRFEITSGALLAVWSFMGIFWFVAKRCPISILALRIATGFIGGAVSLGLWAWALHSLGSDASLYRPDNFSILPLVIGGLVGLASFGWGETFES